MKALIDMNEIPNLSLSDSFSASLESPLVDIAEMGLDTILKDGLLKDIPFISTAISLFKFGSDIKKDTK